MLADEAVKVARKPLPFAQRYRKVRCDNGDCELAKRDLRNDKLFGGRSERTSALNF